MALRLSAALLVAGCGRAPASQAAVADASSLVGAWRARVAFQSGPLAGMKDLEFLYAYNDGGTMTESSNYDEAPNSSPPAYGVWRRRDGRTFETKYLFFTTRATEPADSAPGNHDWWPAGHGELTETVTLSADGQSYQSTIRLVIFDKSGKPVGGDAAGTGSATRITF